MPLPGFGRTDPHRQLSNPRTYVELHQMADIVAQRYQAITDQDNQLPANHVPTEPGSAYNTYQRLTEADEEATMEAGLGKDFSQSLRRRKRSGTASARRTPTWGTRTSGVPSTTWRGSPTW